MTGAGFPHSDTLGSTLGWQLPEAYRSLPRPSSAPGAQASTVCPQHLDHTKPHPEPPTHTGRRPRQDTYKQTLCRHTLCKTEIKRCSRPLCSSQRPTRAPSTRPHQHREHSAGLRPGRPGQRQQPLRPRAHTHSRRARSLRTQQRAYDHHPHPTPLHARCPEGHPAVLGAGLRRRPNWSAFHPRALSRAPAATR
jgi:hypothetical protein